MRFQIWSLGKPHESYVKTGVEEFTSRLNNYYKCEWKIIPLPKYSANTGAGEMKQKESLLVLNALTKNDYLIVLDERGKQFNSEGLARFIEDRANESIKTVVILIGGAYGVDATILARANYTWSLSSLVFPHQLVRLIVAEQLYRAATIVRNEKYHHS